MPSIAPSVIDQLSASMSSSSLQHQVIAANIANRDTPGYQRMKLQFDRVMADPSTASASPEQDLVAMASNATHYQAMARVLSRYFSIAAAIVNPARG